MVRLIIGRFVQFQVLFRKREAVDYFAGIVQPENIGGRAHRFSRYLVPHPQVIEHMHRVCAHLDARADFAQLGRLLVYFDIEAGLEKTARGSKSAEPGAGNEDFGVFHCNLA